MARLIHGGTADQLLFWNDEAKYRAFVGGIGSGKTRAGVVEALRQPAGSRGMVVAPTYDMLRLASLETFFEVAEPFVVNHNKSELVTDLCNGSRIYWRSADQPNRLRGPNLNWFWIDEGAYVKDGSTFKVLIGRLRRAGVKRGWVTTSPAGFNWLWERFVKDSNEAYSLIKASTRNNTFLDKEYIDDLSLQYTSNFARQEIDGEFVDMGDSLVQRSWLKYAPAAPIGGLIITMGVDLAISEKTTADYTAIVVVGHHPGTGTRWVLDAKHERLSFNEVLKFIVQMNTKWRPALINIEAVAFQSAVVTELLRTTNLPVRGMTPNGDKVMRFQPAAARYEQGFIIHSSGLHPDFENELLMFPNGANDDFEDALVLACGFGQSVFRAASGGHHPSAGYRPR